MAGRADQTREEGSQRLHLHSRAESYDFLAQMLARARRRISIFSPTLDIPLLNSAGTIEILGTFATASRYSLARFLVDDAERSIQNNARLVELCRRLSDFIKLQQVDEQDRNIREMFVLVDDSMYLHQRNLDEADYLVGLNTPGEARQLAVRYERMWERSQPIAGVHTLGLSR
jgi:hypothetical protein